MASNDIPPPDIEYDNEQATQGVIDPSAVTANFDTGDVGDGDATARTARYFTLPVIRFGSSGEVAYDEFDNSGSTTELVDTNAHSTYLWHVILAVFALLIAFPFGVFALMLAVSARSKSRSVHDYNQRSARKESRISMILSVAGITIAVLTVAIAVGATASTSTFGSASKYDDETTTITAGEAASTPTSPSNLAPSTTRAPCQFFAYGDFCFKYRIYWAPSVAAPVTYTTTAVTFYANATTSSTGDKAVNSTVTVWYTPPPVAPKLTPRSCRFGVADSTNSSLCYYNARSRVADFTGLSCHADFNRDDGFCYYTEGKPCELASNYHNRFCYKYALTVASVDDCRHGYYVDGECYYDSVYNTSDATCNGFKADRGAGGNDDGYCYFSSTASCRFAANFVRNECYDYVLWGLSLSGAGSCSGVYQTRNCYFKKAKPGTQCSAPWFSIGLYCYSNS